MLTRLEFLRLAARASGALMVAPAWASTATPAAGQSAAADASDHAAQLARISRIIEAYDAQGDHRTATPVDERSADWLADLARQAGAAVEFDPFPLSRIDLRASTLDVGSRRIDGLPLFDGTFTGAQGVRGRLARSDGEGDIALVTTDGAGISSEGRGFAEIRRSPRWKGVVIVTRGAHPGLSPMNAAQFGTPYGAPVLQVGSDHGEWLEARARDGAEAVLIAHADRTSATARNVVAVVRGRGGDAPPVIVMTPRSGWWRCAGERGGGLACWLESMRAVSQARAQRTAIFLASSGHELGHLGLDAHLERHHERIAGALAWVHLGANIGAARGERRLQASEDRLDEHAASALSRAGAAAAVRVPRGTVPAGEARNIHVAGGRYVSLLGSSPFFHNQADRWPTAVDASMVQRCANAVAELVVGLASS